MKGLEKFILIIFSIIIIILSIILVLSSTEMISTVSMVNSLNSLLVSNKGVSIIVGSVLALLGLIGMFSSSESMEEKKGGLAIKNETGTLYLTKDTFESIIIGVTRGYPELRNVKVDLNVSEKGVGANVYVMILPDTVIQTLSTKLQENIKASVLKQTTVEINEVNIKVRGVIEEVKKN